MSPLEADVRAVLRQHLSTELSPEEVRELTARLQLAFQQLELLHALPLEDDEEPGVSASLPLWAAQP